MKRSRILTSTLICLLIFAGCGKAPSEPASAPDQASASADSDFSDDTSVLDGTPDSDGSSLTDSDGTPDSNDAPDSDSGAAASDDTPDSDSASPAELAQQAYSALLAGDLALLDEEERSEWGLDGWADWLKSESLSYEYTYLDLDGDGVDELLFQMKNDPFGHNAVFHYADGRIFCWENDMIEMTSGHYPLSDGTMVSEYYYSGSTSYTIFRYFSDGEQEVLSSLFAREEPLSEESNLPCPYYEIDGAEVDEAAFYAQLEETVTKMLLPRSAWTKLVP
ncbi:MAG: hypothetical protein NC409_01410 [Clostridium sp.]|nr:hypothetical protein [Clostridium sp.]